MSTTHPLGRVAALVVKDGAVALVERHYYAVIISGGTFGTGTGAEIGTVDPEHGSSLARAGDALRVDRLRTFTPYLRGSLCLGSWMDYLCAASRNRSRSGHVAWYAK